MGLFDKLKNAIGNAKGTSQPQPAPEEQTPELEPEDDGASDQSSQLDLAGFDPRDEDEFFNAVLHMESDGQFGGTDESRASAMPTR